MDSIDRNESFILTFFRTTDGAIHCRVLDACTKEHWIAPDAGRLRVLLQPISQKLWPLPFTGL